MAISKAQMSMLQRRRTTDIDRLAQQYKKNVESLTGDYQKSFGEYQARTAEQMKPFEEQMAKYKTDLYPAYQQQVEAYQSRLNQYQAALADIEKNPSEMVDARFTQTRGGRTYIIDGKAYSERNLPEGYFVEDVTRQEQRVNRGRPITVDVTEQKLFRARSLPTFTEKAPEAPQAPAAPQVAAFEASQFDQRRGQLETEFKREVGERKASRLAAVSRSSRRPLLQGV